MNENDEKLQNNLCRTRSRIYELAACNPWEYFVTLTLSSVKYDRYSLSKWHKDLSQWIRNYNRLHNCKVKYLLIPEQHKDGAWHMHGLMMGFPQGALTRNKYSYLDWNAYSSKFGYISMGKIRSLEGVSKYITKYISKDLAVRSKELHAHLFYASQKLEHSHEVWSGTVRSGVIVPETTDRYENEWCAVYWLNSAQLEEFLKQRTVLYDKNTNDICNDIFKAVTT